MGETDRAGQERQLGAKLRAGEVPPPNVYAFAHYIWQQVNHWGRDGDKDYGAAIFRMQAYITPSCREWLELEMIASRDVRPHPKHFYKDLALKKFALLSKRQFFQAWNAAIVLTGASTWSKAGRPKAKIKSAHQSKS